MVRPDTLPEMMTPDDFYELSCRARLSKDWLREAICWRAEGGIVPAVVWFLLTQEQKNQVGIMTLFEARRRLRGQSSPASSSSSSSP